MLNNLYESMRNLLGEQKKFLIPLTIYLTADVLDFISTYLILSRGGIEANSVGRYMIDNFDFPEGMIISKIPHFLIPAIVCYLMNVKSINHDFGSKVMYFLSLFPTLTFVHNFSELLMK